MKKGVFITFEGPDGSGKTTHSLLLCKYLRKQGYQVLHTREPGGTALAEFLRKVLLKPGTNILPTTELLLYSACRIQHTQEIIIPAIKQSKIVICERYADATVAYQSYGRKLNLNTICLLNKIATGGLKPDLTILLDIPAKQRLKKNQDRLEQENISFHKRVRKGYLAIAGKEPKRIKVISTDKTINQTHEKVAGIIDEFLKNLRSR